MILEIHAKTMKIYFFAVKVPNVGISPGFWLIKEKNDVPNIQAHTLKDSRPYLHTIFQNFDFKYWGDASTPFLPQTLTAYPTLGKVVPPTFFRQNEHNGCSNNVLDAQGHFLSRFKTTGKNLGGLQQLPLVKGGLI